MLPVVLAAAALFAAPAAVRAETMKACSAKYQAAKTAGTLNGQAWKDFRKAQCGDTASAATPATATAAAATTAPAAAVPAPPAPTAATQAGGPHTAAPPTIAAASGGSAVFPNKVDPKYASLSAGKARMKTCVDQYKANKAGNGNGGLKWIQKGGGYYSACSRHLKGA